MGMNYRDGVTQAMDEFDKNQVGKHGPSLLPAASARSALPAVLLPLPPVSIYSQGSFLRPSLLRVGACLHHKV